MASVADRERSRFGGVLSLLGPLSRFTDERPKSVASVVDRERERWMLLSGNRSDAGEEEGGDGRENER